MIFDLKQEILDITKAYAAMHGIDMKMPCSNTALLSQHETAQQILDRAPQELPDFSDEEDCKQTVGKALAVPMSDLFSARDQILADKNDRRDEETVLLLKKLRALELALYAEYDQ